MQDKISLSFDIGGTSAKYAFVTADGHLTGKNSFRTAGLKTLDEFGRQLLPVIEQGLARGAVNVGLACPGIFLSDGKCVGGVENLAFLEGVNLPGYLRQHYPSLEVSIMNDGTAAALGEYWMGSGRGSHVLLCVTLGTGIGSALILDGKPFGGSHSQSGELGYSDYSSSGDYLELDYSTLGILRRASEITGTEMDGFAFIRRIKEKDPCCLPLLDDWTTKLGRIIANIILMLDPDRVVIGGGISGEKEILIPLLEEKINRQLPPLFRHLATITPASLANDAGLFGAVKPFFDTGKATAMPSLNQSKNVNDMAEA